MEPWVEEALRTARVARLATAGVDGATALVPICFVLIDGWIASAVDHKPKRHQRLRRLADIDATGAATVLVDHYEEDWTRLWWIRVHGRAVVHRDESEDWHAARAALVAKYVQYRDRPPAGAVYRIALDEVRTWRSADVALGSPDDR